MTYHFDGSNLLLSIDRASIIDISPDDIIEVKGFPGASHVWTEQDSEFIENNPDDDLFLQIERLSENQFRARGILLK